MFFKKGFPKDFFKIIYLCRCQENLVQTLSYEFCGIFRSIYIVEHLWTHTCVKWSNEKMFSLKYIFTEKHRWGCHLKYSCRYEGLEFYLKGTHRYLFVNFMKFYRASVLQNTTYYSATASDFQQHFCLVIFSLLYR